MSKVRPFIVILVTLMLLLLPLRAFSGNSELKKAAFITQWSPQAQFAGYYIALEKGFYRNHELDLTIIDGGAQRSPTQYLESGRAEFAGMLLTIALKKRSRGIPCVNLAQIVQESAFMLVTKKSSGINKPEDMEGRRVGLWAPDSAVDFLAFLKYHHLKVKIIPQSYTLNLFLRGGVEVASATWYNEYHMILNSGVNKEELNIFFLADYGCDFPQDGIYALEGTIKRDPALCASFTDASIEGWKYAFSHLDETLDVVMDYIMKAHIPASRVHQKWMLERMRDLVAPGNKYEAIGTLSPDRYGRVTQMLREQGEIRNIPEFRDFYRYSGKYDTK